MDVASIDAATVHTPAGVADNGYPCTPVNRIVRRGHDRTGDVYAPAWPAVQIQTGGVQLSETLACTTCPPALSPLLLLSISSNRYQENSLAVCRVG